MSTLSLSSTFPQATEPQWVFGMCYRWSYLYERLEVRRMGENWDTSAFSSHVRSAIDGESLVCHDTDRAKAEALIAAFTPIVRTNNSTDSPNP